MSNEADTANLQIGKESGLTMIGALLYNQNIELAFKRAFD